MRLKFFVLLLALGFAVIGAGEASANATSDRGWSWVTYGVQHRADFDRFGSWVTVRGLNFECTISRSANLFAEPNDDSPVTGRLESGTAVRITETLVRGFVDIGLRVEGFSGQDHISITSSWFLVDAVEGGWVRGDDLRLGQIVQVGYANSLSDEGFSFLELIVVNHQIPVIDRGVQALWRSYLLNRRVERGKAVWVERDLRWFDEETGEIIVLELHERALGTAGSNIYAEPDLGSRIVGQLTGEWDEGIITVRARLLADHAQRRLIQETWWEIIYPIAGWVHEYALEGLWNYTYYIYHDSPEWTGY